MLKQLLFATDFSAQAEQVLYQIKALAGETGARVTLLHVNQNLIPALVDAYALSYPASMGELSRELDASLRQRLEDQRLFLSQAGIDAVSVMAQGHAGAEIVTQARYDGSDLIMLGRRGFGHLRTALLGSTSQYVLHHSPCPVLVLPDRSGDQSL